MKTMMNDEELAAKCEARQLAAEQRDAYAEQVQDLSTEIGTELALRGVDRVELPEFTALLLQMPRHTLNKQRLLEQGVPMAAIEAATETTMSVQVRVSRRQNGVKKALLKAQAEHKKKMEKMEVDVG